MRFFLVSISDRYRTIKLSCRAGDTEGTEGVVLPLFYVAKRKKGNKGKKETVSK